MNRILLSTLFICTFIACEEAAPPAAVPPTLDDVSTERSALQLVDRTALVAGAVDHHVASAGQLVDLTSEGALMAFTADGAVDTEGVPTERDGTFQYSNIWAGAAALGAAETVRHAVVNPPAVAIAFTANGEITQLEPNVWSATNTIDLPEGPLTTTFTVAWVGVGWLAEMRYSSAGATDVLWFNGFLGNEGNVGWWDLYSPNGREGVVEWIADGQGNGQFGIAATAGAEAGTLLSYTFAEDVDRIDFLSGPTGETAYVLGYSDGGGEVQLDDFNGGEPACWGADHMNVVCE